MGHLNHGNLFTRPDSIANRTFKFDPWHDFEVLEKFSPDCAWTDCHRPRFFDMPVCQGHAQIIHFRVGNIDTVDREVAPQYAPKRRPDSLVYYLMVGPKTVKIGSTIKLRERLSGLRTQAQYVVALEPGGWEQEALRHRQFADERHGRLENFHLSPRLIAHISELQPQRDELMELALNPRPA